MAELRLDPDAQPRTAIDSATVAEYRDALAAGAIFDNIAAFFDGSVYWLADGFHRAMAYKSAGRSHIPGNVYKGGKREAILFAAGANATHGLKRTNADKRRAVTILLGDAEWATWSDHEIARRCGVTHQFVGTVRRELSPPPTSNIASAPARKAADGRTMNTANIGRKPSGSTRITELTQDEIIEATIDFADQERADSTPEADDEPELEPLPAPIVGSGTFVNAGDDSDDEPIVEDFNPRGDAWVEPDDAEWLASLPLSSKLTGQALRRFHADALLYRTMESHRRTLGHHAAIAMNTAKREGGADGPYLYRLDNFLRLQSPKLWKCCPPTDKGGCGGLGHLPLVGKCPHKLCRGRGYWII
jgi:hypothetical protein